MDIRDVFYATRRLLPVVLGAPISSIMPSFERSSIKQSAQSHAYAIEGAGGHLLSQDVHFHSIAKSPILGKLWTNISMIMNLDSTRHSSATIVVETAFYDLGLDSGRIAMEPVGHSQRHPEAPMASGRRQRAAGTEHILPRLVRRYVELSAACYRVSVSCHDERGRFKKGHRSRSPHASLVKKIDLDRALARVYEQFFGPSAPGMTTSTSNNRSQGSLTLAETSHPIGESTTSE